MINYCMEKNKYSFKTRYNTNSQDQIFDSRSKIVNINQLLNRVKNNEKDGLKKNISIVIFSLLILISSYFLIF